MPELIPAATEVLIVGAGPAGLTMAVSLAQLGIDHVVIDPKPGVAPGSKAAAVQPRTLEYLDRIGVADVLVHDGLPGAGFNLVDGDRRLLRLSYERLASPYPFLLLVSQDQTERRLEERLHQLGGHVHRGVRLLDFVDEFPGSGATVVTADGSTRVINARYVIGCDGLHSTVRRRTGLTFPGDAPEALFALADIVLDSDGDSGRDTTFSLSRKGMLISSALPGGLLRVVAEVPPDTPAPDRAAVTALLRDRGPKWAREVAVKDILSSSTYRVQQRVVTTMSRGNVFLAGDAAHTHSPAGGQGMNTGIQDAANLAWKLHHVITGRAGPALLDTYHAERHPVAEQLVSFTSQITNMATIRDSVAADVRNAALAAISTVAGATDWLADKMSQLSIGYPTTQPAPSLAGTRLDPRIAKPQGLSWTVVTPPATTVTDIPDGVTVTTSAAIDTPIAVRPDGIVANTELAAEALGIDTSAPRGGRS